MKKWVVVAVMTAVMGLFWSCSDDDNSTNPTDDDPVSNFRTIEDAFYEWDGASWSLSNKDNFTYTNERITSISGFDEYDGNSSSIVTYDNSSTKLPSEILIQDDSKQTPKSKYLFTYNDNKVAERLELEYNSGTFENKRKHSYEYDGNLLTKNITYRYESGSWENIFEDTWIYDSGRLIEHTCTSIWESEQSKRVYSYSDGNLSEMVWYYWNAGWEIEFKDVYEYDNGKLSTKTTYDYESLIWEKSGKRVYEYSDDKLINYTKYEWDSNNSIWVNDWKVIYEYDINGNFISHTWNAWNETQSAFTPNEKSSFVYEDGHGNYIDIQKIFEPEDFFTSFSPSPIPTK
jgi:hypothetical protein